MRRLPNALERANAGRGKNYNQCNASKTDSSTRDRLDPGAILSRRNATCSRPTTIPQNQGDAFRRIDSEDNASELPLIYDKHLQGKLEMMIVEEKCQTRQREIFLGLAAMAKTYEDSERKLSHVRTRKDEVFTFIAIQKSMDTDIEETTVTLQTYGKSSNMLLKIKLLISDSDVLMCQDAMIPRVQKEIYGLQLSLGKSIDSMRSLNKRINMRSLTISVGRKFVEEFTEAHRSLNKKLKTLKDNLNNLQVQVLKKTSSNLASSS